MHLGQTAIAKSPIRYVKRYSNEAAREGVVGDGQTHSLAEDRSIAGVVYET